MLLTRMTRNEALHGWPENAVPDFVGDDAPLARSDAQRVIFKLCLRKRAPDRRALPDETKMEERRPGTGRSRAAREAGGQSRET